MLKRLKSLGKAGSAEWEKNPDSISGGAMKASLLLALVCTALLSARATAQAPPEWQDSLVEHMAGSWIVGG